MNATAAPWHGRYVVYRVYSDTGELLYVGCSKRFVGRWNEHAAERHRGGARWFPEAHRVRITIFADRYTALVAEAHAIATEKPSRNIYRGYIPRQTVGAA